MAPLVPVLVLLPPTVAAVTNTKEHKAFSVNPTPLRRGFCFFTLKHDPASHQMANLI